MDKVFEGIREFLARQHITVYGVAQSSALEAEPAGYRPSDLLAGARSLFCAGVAVPKGILRAGARAETSYWRTAAVIYRHLDAILVRCAAIMEEAGELAVPVFGCFPYDVRGKGDFWGYVNLVKMAELARLGKPGKNGVLINSKVGPRLLLGGIVTTARLPAVPSADAQDAACPEDCFVCQDACPVKAIDRSGKVDRLQCVRHSIRSPLFLHMLKSGNIDASHIEMLNHVCAVDDHSVYTCIACVAACPMG